MHTYFPNGVCSQIINVSLDKEQIINKIEIIGGCQGNLSGLSKMCQGQKAQDVIDKLKGIRCGHKMTSCPDQLAIAIGQALRQPADDI